MLNLLGVASESDDAAVVISLCLPRLRVHIEQARVLFDMLAKVPTEGLAYSLPPLSSLLISLYGVLMQEWVDRVTALLQVLPYTASPFVNKALTQYAMMGSAPDRVSC